MKLTPKPWVVKVLKGLAVLLSLVFVLLIVIYFVGMDNRVTELEARPTLQVIKEVRIEVTATPSAKPTLKKFVPVSVVPSK